MKIGNFIRMGRIGMILFILPILSILINFSTLSASHPIDSTPVAYKGRFRPMEAYTRLWVQGIHHKEHLKNTPAQDFMWKVHFNGAENYNKTPLFWVHLAELKETLGLNKKQNHFTYNQIQEIARAAVAEGKASEELASLLQNLQLFSQLQSPEVDKEYLANFNLLKSRGYRPQEIAEILNKEHPLTKRLAQADILFPLLPSKQTPGKWLPLRALKCKIYDSEADTLVPISNFTAYSDLHFVRIREEYLKLENAVTSNNSKAIQKQKNALAKTLNDAYSSIEGKVYTATAGKTLAYPSWTQLHAERIYYQYPLTEVAIALYTICLCLFLFGWTLKRDSIKSCAIGFLLLAFLVHTFILAIRCFILARPPVSNMFETVIYVPWIGVVASLILRCFFKQANTLLAVSSLASLALLTLLKIMNMSSSLDNVQAVLDSQYWLIVHVLMIVGSYGIFILSGILGHCYLALSCFYLKETDQMKFLAKFILQSMYLGIALLIPGTILGGVWAAESWGRFWDWDPKESWAFISSAIYLIWVHAYRFKQIHNFGLAFGAVTGLLAISFTWYGVNYILGTGLHSYGFGSGGEGYYYLFLIAEVTFLGMAVLFRQMKLRVSV